MPSDYCDTWHQSYRDAWTDERLREELSQLIGDNDERWYAFGFDKPSDPSTPEVPENLVVTPGAPGSKMTFVNWDDARRATGYRLRVTDPAGVQLAEHLTQDSEFAVNGNLSPGTQIRISISARNAAGESQATAPVTATVP